MLWLKTTSLAPFFFSLWSYLLQIYITHQNDSHMKAQMVVSNMWFWEENICPHKHILLIFTYIISNSSPPCEKTQMETQNQKGKGKGKKGRSGAFSITTVSIATIYKVNIYEFLCWGIKALFIFSSPLTSNLLFLFLINMFCFNKAWMLAYVFFKSLFSFLKDTYVYM